MSGVLQRTAPQIRQVKMDNKKWIAFKTTVEVGSITRAAELLGYSQPGLTGLLNRLEKEVGYPLLDRSHHGVLLTARGKALLPYIDRLLDDYDAFEKAAKQLRHERKNALSIASYSSISRNWMPQIVNDFSRKYPRISLMFKDGSPDEIAGWLIDGSIDIGLFSHVVPARIDFIPLIRDPYYAVLPSSWETAGTVDIRRFEDQAFLVPSNSLDKEVPNLLQRYGVTPRFSAISVEDYAIPKMVEYGFGVSILSRLILQNCTANVRLAPISPPAFRELGIGILSLKNANPYMLKFISFLKTFAAEQEKNSS